ncbi:HAD hydrolase family protein [Kosakonia cowanii]|uniref:HAD hydrolase family protein n=1 Tax=Kosakonia cowanii TaxID=208223 RepID=UPI004062D086
MTSRVIALDLDGTLLTPKKTLLPSSLEALARAKAAGHLPIIVTGRHHVAIHPFYQALALDTPAICCNGTYLSVYRLLQHSHLPKAILQYPTLFQYSKRLFTLFRRSRKEVYYQKNVLPNPK